MTKVAVLACALAAPSVTDFIIGNEPNLNLFWMPQYKKSRGKWVDASGAAYESLLAGTYDYLKAYNADIDVIGVGLSPRGTDHPTGVRPSHSPITFLQALGAAYRASHRTR